MSDVDIDLSKTYVPTAIYYEDADSVEYVRRDVPAIYQRIDSRLTLIASVDRREVIGFQLKGFKNFFIRDLEKSRVRREFYSLVGALERAFSELGEEICDGNLKLAYDKAWHIALEDRVALSDLPKVA